MNLLQSVKTQRKSAYLKENQFKIGNFRSRPKQTFFAPEWDCYLMEGHIKNVNWKSFAKYILEKESFIKQLPIRSSGVLDGYTGLGKDSTTAHFSQYNVLEWDHPAVPLIRNAIIELHERFLDYFKQKYPPALWAQCWVNVVRKGQHIAAHLHTTAPDAYLGGQITVKTQDTSTCYINPVNQINEPEEIKSPNKVGKLTLFQNYMPHYTTPYNGEEQRITLAMDLSLAQNKNNFIKLV